MIRTIASSIVMMVCTSAFAQTADETALFVLTGKVLDGRALAELSFEIKDNRKLTGRVVRTGECKYSLIVNQGGAVTEEYAYDFNLAGSAKLEDSRIAAGKQLSIGGDTGVFCTIQFNGSERSAPRCRSGAIIFHEPFGEWDMERALKAYDYLKATYCKGRAF